MNLRISVIAPAYNEEGYIEECIGSILNNDYREKEIIVVNDCSTDRTKEKIEKFLPKINLINNRKNEGIVQSIKIGIDASRGEIIVKTNADCIVPNDWLEKIAGYFKDEDIIGVTGNYKPLNRNKIVACLEIIDDFFLNKLKRRFSLSRLSGPCWAVRRDFLNALTFWKERKINDEGNLWLEIKNRGKIIYDRGLIVKGNFPGTLRAVWQRKSKWGMNAFRDKYYRDLQFWTRPLYFFIFVLAFISVSTPTGKILFSIVLFPLLIIFFFSLFKQPALSFVVPCMLLFSEFAWVYGAAKEALKMRLKNS